MNKYILGSVLALGLISPILTQAQVQGDIDPNGSASACVTLQYNLTVGSRDSSTGGDVSELQDFLQSKGYLNINPTGYFGQVTRAAVTRFQAAGGILNSGYVGPITRARIQSTSCSDAPIELPPITITPPPAACSGGALFNSATGKRCVSAEPILCTTDVKLCPDGSYVSRGGPSCTFGSCPTVGGTPKISSISPTRIYVGTTTPVTLYGTNFNSTLEVALTGPGADTGVRPTYVSSGGDILTFSFPAYIKIPGNYTVQLHNSGIPPYATINLTVLPSSSPSITVTSPVAGDTLYIGKSTIISWLASSPSARYSFVFRHTDGEQTYSSGGYSASEAHCDAAEKCYVSFSLPDYAPMVSRSVTVSVYDDTGRYGTSGAFKILSPAQLPTTPIVTLTATPSSITAGQGVIITYNVTNATSCTASGGWSGTYNGAGDKGMYYPTQTTTYTLTCTGTGGSTTKSETVTVAAGSTPPPSLSACNLDVDGNGQKDALTDGLLLLRYISGSRGTTLTNGAIGSGATRTSASSIEAFIAARNYDVDGNGTIDMLTDAPLIYRYLSYLTGSALTSGVIGSGATRTTSDQIVAWLNSCAPVTQAAAAPTITSISPTQGSANTTVTISGTNLSGTDSVVFRSLSGSFASSLIPTSVNSTGVNFTIGGPVATMPAGSYEVYVVVVTAACTGGCVSNRVSFTLNAPPSTASCSLSGQTIAHGASVTAYQASTVSYGSACVSEQRSCTNGVLSGSYTNTSCTVSPAPSVSTCNLDVDGNGKKDALTDGLLIQRYLSGMRGAALIADAVPADATRTSASAIESFIAGHNYDADGNGTTDMLTDAPLIFRYLFGVSGSSLISNAVGSGATRTTAEQILTWLNACSSSSIALGGTSGVVAGATTNFRYTWNTDLQVGSTGADVSALQIALTSEGVYSGEVTGGFYNETFSAVQAFQRKYDINATGYVGPATRTKLNELY